MNGTKEKATTMNNSTSTARVLAFTPLNPTKPNLPQPTLEESAELRKKWAGFEIFLEELQAATVPWLQQQHGKLTPEQQQWVNRCWISAFGLNDDGTPFHRLIVIERRPSQSA